MTFLYPTASTTAVFLNGFHVEQAFQLQYKESTNKIPIYGYNDFHYSKIAIGRSLVQGILVINFIFPGYLNSVLANKYTSTSAFVPELYNYGFAHKGQAQKEKLVENISNELKTELPPNASPEERSARANYIASLISKDKATKEATKKALQNFWLESDIPVNTSIISSPLEVQNEGSMLDIYYQDPAYETWFVRFSNVHVYENSQVISQAGAEGSADNLFEVYNWIASSKQIKLIKEIQ